MVYNKYMTEHVETNKYFYVRGGIFQKRSKYCKAGDCFKISSYGIDKIERCLKHRLKSMTNIRRKRILCKIHDISHGKNTTRKLCKKPNKYCNENNCYTAASFNFKIDDRPIKCKKQRENNMINVKRKYIVNNNTKIIYKKGYICENNNKKGGSIKNNKIKKVSKRNNLILLNPYNRPIDIENQFMRKKELAVKEIEQEFSNLLLNDNITDWYKNEDDELYYDNGYTSSYIYKSIVNQIEKNNYKMRKKLIKRKVYRKYGLDCKKIDDDLKYHISDLESGLRNYYDIRYRMDNFNKVYKKLIEFNNLIYEDNRNMDSGARYWEKWCTPIDDKPEIKKEKIVYDKSKILELENKIKEGIDEHIFLKKNLDLLEKSDKNLEIYKKSSEIHGRITKCLSKLNTNIKDLMEMKSLIKKII